MHKEIVHHYINNNSDVYACHRDASKAFDGLNYVKPFSELIKRKIPAIFLRYFMYSYTHRDIKCEWQGTFSSSFSASNGAPQGQVLSPIFFNCYLDILLEKLRKLGVGCYIGNHYVGCGAYADDVQLLSPTVSGLQKMINVCEGFSKEYCLKFNEKKTVCVKYSKKVEPCNKHITLNGKLLSWDTKVKHLGNYITCNLDEVKEINAKKGSFISSMNRVIAKFSGAPFKIKCKIFQSFCTSFYGSQAWYLFSGHLDKLETCWNKGLRRLFNVYYTTHRFILHGLINQPGLKTQLLQRSHKAIMQYCYSLFILMIYLIP